MEILFDEPLSAIPHKNGHLIPPALPKATMSLSNAPRTQTTASASAWDNLPAELKLAVLDNLGASDTRSLALVDRQSHALCVPVLFRVSGLQLCTACSSVDIDADRGHPFDGRT